MSATLIERPSLRSTALVPPVHVRGERWLVGLMLAAIAVLYSANIGGFPTFFDDEGTYYMQAWAVQHMDALAPFTYWYDHPPLGWIQIAGLSWLPSMLLGSAPSLVAGRIVMVVFTLATALLMYILAKRFGMRPGFAAVAVLLWALCPLVLYQSRQVYLDNTALPWMIGAFVLASGSRRSLWAHTAAGMVFGVAVLSKETIAVVFPALLLTVWHYSYKPTRAFSMMGVTMATVVTGLVYPLYAVLKNELLPGPHHVSLWDALYFQFHGRSSSGQIWSKFSGSHYVLADWLSHDRWLLGLGVLAAVGTLLIPRLRPLGLAGLLVLAVMLKPGGYLPWMYIIAALPFMALALAGVLDRLWSVHHGAAVLVTGIVTGLMVAWTPGLATAVTANDNPVHSQVVAYATAHLPKDSRLVVDPTYWNDMVRAGWEPNYGKHGVIWGNKVDEDSSAKKRMPHGWRDIDYFIDTSHLESADPNNPAVIVQEGLKHTKVLATFGRGTHTTTVLEVVK